MGGANDNVIAIARREGNLYQITFKEVCGVNSANFIHSRAGADSVKL